MKVRTSVVIFSLSLFCLGPIKAQDKNNLKLWYNKPAHLWNEALPIGNGRIAAMVFGDPKNEKLQLNEATFWSGGPSRNDNEEGAKVLDSVRYYLFNKEYKKAEQLANKGLTAKQNNGSAFQNIGYLNLDFDVKNYQNYYRELDISNSLFTTTFESEGVTYKREVFASLEDHVIVMRISANKKGKISFKSHFDSELLTNLNSNNSSTIIAKGLSKTQEGVEGKVKYQTLSKFINKGGTIASKNNGIEVKNADEVLILLSIATNFTNYKSLSSDEVKQSEDYLAKAQKKTFQQLLKRQVDRYQNYFNRVQFSLGNSINSQLPTDIRIQQFSKNWDPELLSLYFQFGRYLLISSSQKGGQPANLQGIWNESNTPAWDSKYTININTEMNYWPAEKTNLPEMHEPLIAMISDLSQSGKETAKTMYNAQGWVAHHNTDIWRTTGAVDFANAGQWPMGSAWLSQHLWDKYLYSGDKKYLESVYPILKSACAFYEDFLIKDPQTNWLVVSPSISPENTPENHNGSALTYGATMDNQLMFDLFSKTIEAANSLHLDQNKIATWKNILQQLPPMKIGKYGQLQEWLDDWDNPKDKHRHISHLYGLFPSNQISMLKIPELFDAAKTVLLHRGDQSTGWSMGWKVNLRAKLLDGNHAFKLIKDQLTLVDPKTNWSEEGGTYPNMFDAHPPFQIDGNFGCTSGITEMLLQTQNGFIDILPALPDDWKSGEITGLRTYGGFEVSIKWDNNQIQEIIIKSHLGGNCRINVRNVMELVSNSILKIANGDNPNPFFKTPTIAKPIIAEGTLLNVLELKPSYTYDFETEAGKTYKLKIKN